jgi:hypothetical protein
MCVSSRAAAFNEILRSDKIKFRLKNTLQLPFCFPRRRSGISSIGMIALEKSICLFVKGKKTQNLLW